MYRAMGQLQFTNVPIPTGPSTLPIQQPGPSAPKSIPAQMQPPSADANPNIYANAAQACLNTQQLLALAACVAGTPPPGVSPSVFQQTCQAARQSGMFSFPICPGAALPPVPACLDDAAQKNVIYCERYPNSDGPDAVRNGVCWAARKAPAWYDALKAVPFCPMPGQTPPEPEAPPAEPPQSTDPNYLLWGGLILLAVGVVGGTVYYATKK